MDKEIEEIARTMCRHFGTTVCASCDAHKTCMIHFFAEDIRAAGYRKQEWIPVDERMPDPNEYDWVLVAVKFNEDGTYGVPMVAEFRRGKWWESGGEFSLDELFLTVTHWMPLPETPKGESDER